MSKLKKVRKRSHRDQAVEISRDGGIGSLIGRHPRESVAIVMATAATIAIFINALFLQKGPHPSPIFATRLASTGLTPAVASHLRTGPANAVQSNVATDTAGQTQLISNIQRELNRRGFYDGAIDGIWGAKTDTAARDFVQAAGAKINPDASDGLLRAIVASNAKRVAPDSARSNDPIAALIAPSARVLAIQRALADFGYGQIKPTGIYDPATRAAIEKFERDRRLPVTGQISDRFVRDLAAMSGRPLE